MSLHDRDKAINRPPFSSLYLSIMSELSPELPVPESLSKKIGSFIKRSNELEKFQPVIAYFCKLYAVDVILKEKLHQQSKEIEAYAFHLLDKVELTKLDFKENNPKISELINDSDSSFKLVLGFSNSIFNRSFQEITNHNSSTKTVQNFKASLDFYQLLKLWDDLYEDNKEEIEKQIKYAKFHSMRILKSIKSGEDPNDYITPEEETELKHLETAPTFNKAEPETETQNQSDELQLPTTPSQQVTSAFTESQEQDELTNELITDTDPEEIDTSFPNPPSGLQSPVISPYFQDTGNNKSLELPTAPDDFPGELNMPTAPVLIKGEKNELGLPNTPSLPPKPEIPSPPPKSSVVESASKVTATPTTQKPSINLHHLPKSRTSSVVVSEGHKISSAEIKKFLLDDEKITLAQKKARFAISALNYEDVDTAIKELESALKLLKGE